MILLSSVALAIPGIPHQFYGSVTYNGKPAPDGLSVVATINGDIVASTTTSGGNYGYSPIFYVEDPNNDRSGETITFIVNGVDTGQSAIFQNGRVSRLDLAATGPSVTPTTVPEETGGSSTGGSTTGGSTGGNGATTTESEETTTAITETTIETCQEKWTCTEWSECKDGIQTRTCKDENNCGTDLHKPLESQPCVVEEKTATTKSLAPITGFFALIPSQTLIGLVTIILIVVIFFGWRKIFRKK